MKERYWLQTGTLAWQEATREQFIQAEKSAGFYPKPGCGDVATAGFSGKATKGRITSGEVSEENYGWDPEFLKIATATTQNP
ncbi:hypothetical protein HON36_00575 [Candidatus Parcubacteria bacterium]|jgi:hypothetical protein|nr:hypothetical protein [Candidatus Parcubacteria bacterium]MBT7228626.1 hypothetical protein [Candidatus Parcubacteria bacterium]